MWVSANWQSMRNTSGVRSKAENKKKVVETF